MGLELIRQIHYFICEHSASYYQFWRNKVFAGVGTSASSRIDPWKRHQCGAHQRRSSSVLVVFNLIVARIFDTSFFRAPYELLDLVRRRHAAVRSRSWCS